MSVTMSSPTSTARSMRVLARISSSSRAFSTSSPSARPKRGTTWAHASHLFPEAALPAPLPAIYPQRVVLSSGASFVSHTTAPAPAVLRLTRDVDNNTLWNPRKEGRREEGEGGRVERFRARFGGGAAATSEAQEASASDSDAAPSSAAGAAGAGAGFSASDLDWMSEGATEYKPSAKEMQGSGGAKKGAKKK